MGGGTHQRYVEIAAELVQRKVDVIVTSGAAVAAIKQATSIIPVVFAVAGDPLGSGLVVSLSDLEATLPACRCNKRISLPNALNCCVKPANCSNLGSSVQ